ncbi:hypothetical protein SPKIRA_12200 [Sphingomonas paucimobilis]|nr:hypothetical protein SPKIRA_12200 [Sphingomonas paucimobilis]
MLGFIHAGAQLRPAGAQLVGNLPPDLCRGGMIGLEEDWRMAAATTVFWPLGTYASALRMKWTRQRCRGAEDAGDCRLEAFVGIRDDQPDPRQPAAGEVLEEVGPEHLGLRWADVQADDLALALGVDGNGDYRGDADDPAARRTFRYVASSQR